MRTIEEINADIASANINGDAELLRALATELQELGTPMAMATALITFGTAALRTSDYLAALEFFLNALALSEEHGFREHVAIVTANVGNTNLYLSNYSSALDHYHRALAIHEEIGDRMGTARVTGNIGLVHSTNGDYTTALECYHRALTIHEELDDRNSVALVTGNIGNLYKDIGDYPSALEYLHRALSFYEELGNRRGVANIIGYLGTVYAITGDYPRALEHFHRAVALMESIGYRIGVATHLSNIGVIHSRTRDHTSALEHYQRSLVMHQEIGDRSGEATCIDNLGSIYASLGDIPKALDYHRNALAIHEELGDKNSVARDTCNIVSALMELNRHDEAMHLLEGIEPSGISNPLVQSLYHKNRAFLYLHGGDLEAAKEHHLRALSLVTDVGARAEAADCHKFLRDLAQKRNDFAGYIEHNNEYNRITEEIRGKESIQRLAMMEAERKMEAERRERDKERALLHGALPKSVADRMLRGEDVTGDQFNHAAIMFADIVGFTAHTSSMSATEVVKLLEGLFSSIDGFCDAHNVVKIKTVGDSYLCFRGDADARTNAVCIMHVALDVMNGSFTWPNGEPLQFRIGLHIGEATAGVIGTQRLQYDVWGDTVNVASRMESSGEPGRIHVSAAFATFLADARNDSAPSAAGSEGTVIPNGVRNEELGTWHLIPRGSINIKGKGAMETYWLIPPSSSTVPL